MVSYRAGALPDTGYLEGRANTALDTIDPCCIIVDIEGEGGNPLVKGSPPIQYYYKLVFDLTQNELRYIGTHTPYPWHELYVSEVGSLHQFSPKAQWWGAIANPLLLAAGNTESVPFKRIPVDMGTSQGNRGKRSTGLVNGR